MLASFPGFFAVFLLVFTVGCAPLTTVRSDGSTVRHHFGYVRVVTPDVASSDGGAHALEVSSVGLRVHRGVGLGYARDRTEYIPMDNRLIVRVANQEQFDQAMEILTPIVKDGLCIIVD